MLLTRDALNICGEYCDYISSKTPRNTSNFWETCLTYNHLYSSYNDGFIFILFYSARINCWRWLTKCLYNFNVVVSLFTKVCLSINKPTDIFTALLFCDSRRVLFAFVIRRILPAYLLFFRK